MHLIGVIADQTLQKIGTLEDLAIKSTQSGALREWRLKKCYQRTTGLWDIVKKTINDPKIEGAKIFKEIMPENFPKL